jgi:type II secretory pathway component PulM
MSMPIKEILRWLNTLDPEQEVSVDDGGLTLVVTDYPDEYLEIGGIPDGDE